MVLRVRELTLEEGRKLQRILRHGQDFIEFKRAQIVPNFEHRPSIEVGAETAELPGVTQTVSMGSTHPHCTGGVRQRYGRRSICYRRDLRSLVEAVDEVEPLFFGRVSPASLPTTAGYVGPASPWKTRRSRRPLRGQSRSSQVSASRKR
jgi:hypothetical protein